MCKAETTNFRRIKVAMDSLWLLAKDEYPLSHAVKPLIEELFKACFIHKKHLTEQTVKQVSANENSVIVDEEEYLSYFSVF